MMLLFGLFMVAALSAQKRVGLTGVVLDQAEQPVVGATVLLLCEDTLAAGGMSDAKGRFALEGLPQATYLLRLTAIGYKAEERSLRLDADRRLGAICLQEESYALDEVTVRADQRALVQTGAAGSTFHISEKLKAEAHNVYQALREVPLLSVNETERSIKMVDGSTPIILINGVRRTGAEASIDPRRR